MNQVLNEISVVDLARMFPVLKTDGPSVNFVFGKQDHDELSGVFYFPCRFNGFFFIICLEGELTVHFNLKTFTLHRNMVFFCGSGSIIQIQQEPGARFYLAGVSEYLAQEMEPNGMQYYNSVIWAHFNPCLSFNEYDFETLVMLEEVMSRLLDTNILERKELLLSYLNSMLFFLRSFWKTRQKEIPAEGKSHSPRAQGLVDEFIQLVTEHHMKEHYLAYYAEKLGITPKYLSKLVRDVTGRSAPDWIDSFLVLEAKNMLKYSNMAIKEIVYEMRFPDQSSFYKFFKLHTGMIPSEYRKL